jgi:hypothetical protein
MGEIKTAKVLSIKECDHDEAWLGHMIYEDPSILGLGELQTAGKEVTQPQGGRLDILLKNPEDNSMYEVELQLGPTDESHIIRTIEYWDNAKKQWPKRSHTAVLVAEQITSRFFNVVQLLSTGVPIIGIQANIVQVGEAQALHFTKVIDSYHEPEEEEAAQPRYSENDWKTNYPATLECARWYRDLLMPLYGDVIIKYFRNYMSLTFGGIARLWVSKRKNDRSLIELFMEGNRDEAADYLTKEGVAFNPKYDHSLTFNVNFQQLKDKKSVHEWLAQRLAPSHLIKRKN